jgi:hypothetical protein
MPLILDHTDIFDETTTTEEFKGYSFEHPSRLMFEEYTLMQQVNALYSPDSAEWYLMMFCAFTVTRTTEKWEKREGGVSRLELAASRFAKLTTMGLPGATQQKFARFVEDILLKEQTAVQATETVPEPQTEGVQSGKAKKPSRKRSI